MENQQIPVAVYAEMTPNPNTMKYVANQLLVPGGLVFEFLNANECKNFPLAERLFTFPFVKAVFITNNFITVTKNQAVDWNDITMELREYITNYLVAGYPVYENLEGQKNTDEQDSQSIADDLSAYEGVLPSNEKEERIFEILADYVQPAVENDGGAIHFKSYDEASGKLNVELKGSCNGCPSSTVTLKNGILSLFQQMMPEVKEVVSE